MEISWLKGLVAILAESFKIFPKNPNLMTWVTILILIFNTLVYSISLCFLKLLFNSYQSMSPDLDPNTIFTIMASIFAYQLILALILSMSSFVLASTTILASAITHGGKNRISTVKRLLSSLLTSWKSSFVTWIYTTLIFIGYMCTFVAIMYPFMLLLLSSNPRLMSIVLLMFGVVGSILYLYIDVVLSLGLVVSVVEQEVRGLEAIGKAAKITKGMKLQGFVVNLLYGMVGWGLVKLVVWVGVEFPPVGQVLSGMGLVGFGWPVTGQLFVGLVISSCICVMKMLWWMAYTVMYFEGMKRHGEEVVELGEEMEYTKVPMEARV